MRFLNGKLVLAGLTASLALGVSAWFVGTAFAEDDLGALALGDKHFEEKSYLKAYEAYEKFLKEDPDTEDKFRIRLRMGHCMAQLGRHDKAEKELTTLADDSSLSELERGRVNYRLGHYFMDRPHYYYQNSKGEKAWGRWIADSRYHSTENKDYERSKDRLLLSWKLLKPEGKKAFGTIGKDPKESIGMAEEAYNAGLDAAAAWHTYQYRLGSERVNVDYLDDHGQKQTYSLYRTKFPDKQAIIELHAELATYAQELKSAGQSILVQGRELTPEEQKGAEMARDKGHNMAALALYRQATFQAAILQISDWSMRNLIYHPELEEYDPLDSEYSPIGTLDTIYRDYHDTVYADDAQYFKGYVYQQLGQHTLAVKAYKTLIADETFKDSTETSTAKYNLQQIVAHRLSVATVRSDKDIADDKKVRKWANNSHWSYRRNEGVNRSLFKKGEKLGLWVETRNIKDYKVRALTFDLSSFINDVEFLEAKAAGFNSINNPTLKPMIDRNTGEQIFEQAYKTGDNGEYKFTQMRFQLPETLPIGAYIIETDIGDMVDRRLMVVSDLQIVIQNYSPTENLALVVDSTTGAPQSNTPLTYKRWKTWWKNNKQFWRVDVSNYATDEQGRARVPTAGSAGWDGYLLFAETNGRYAFMQSGFPWWQRRGWGDNHTADTRVYPMTDRPVYRPGDTVHLKTILRQRNGGEWANVANRGFRLEIQNPRGERKFNKVIRASDFGAISTDLELADDAALGSWYFYIRSSSGNWLGSGYFQVEEYKKPEFEVKVSPPEKPVKLGQAISAKIQADYYFGAPVSEAKVSYRVYRNFYYHSVYFPREYDWLYNWQSPMYYGTPDQQFNRNGHKELILSGEEKTDADGALTIEWSTEKALKDWGEYDHRYEVQVEITDSSRRTITGSGTVKALRRAFFAFVDNKLGFYRPNDELDVEVRTVTADDKPVETKGTMEMHKVTFTKRTDENGLPKIDESKTLVKTWDIATDERGIAFFNERVTEAGTYDLIFRTKDEWGTEIVGQRRIIVKASEWIPGSYRFDTISLIPQKRVYTQGETARVLLASEFKDAWMLISVIGGRDVMTQEFVSLSDVGGQLELEINIARRHVPNFHINVMTVQNGELHTKTLELFVPPVDQFLDVDVTTDKDWYLPGDKGQLTVTAKDSTGAPVRAEFAISVYDRSITYIAAERTPNIYKHFYGDRRGYRLNYVNSYNTNVGTEMRDTRKWEDYRWYGAPLGYGVKNWLRWERNAFDFNSDVSKTDRFRRGFESSNEKARKIADDPSSPKKELGDSDGGLREKSASKREWGGEGQGDGASGGFAGRRARGGGGAPSPNTAAPGESPMDEMAEESESTNDDKSDRSNRMEESLKKVSKDANMAAPKIRTDFRDSMFYGHSVVTGADGIAKVDVNFPDNLTDWSINVRGITEVAKVGETFDSVKVKKNLILRDQAPRFFVEGDSVTLSANIMNRYDHEVEIQAMLMINPTDGDNTQPSEGVANLELFPETPGTQTFTLAAKSEKRVDWRVSVKNAGEVKIRMVALSKKESDATEKTYTSKVRGAEMVQGVTAVIKDGEESKTFEVNLPEKMDPSQTTMDLMLSPSVAALAMDALPYLLDFPYGCVEQTMSRFLPAVMVRKTLEDAGISLEEVGARRKELDYNGLNPQAAYWYKHSPVFDSNVMNAIIAAGLKRLRIFQHSDGGWGWWRGGRSDVYMSAYVVYGLHTAKEAGVKFDNSMLTRGISFLTAQARKEKNLHRAAYVAYVLSYAGSADKELLDKVYDRRDDLNNQSRAMVCMAEWLAGDQERAKILISNLEDYRQEDKEAGTTWWYGGKEYWYWYNDRIETNAFVMQAFVMVDPTNKYLESHVRWLTMNRKGSRWKSTKDTSFAVAALMAYAKATGELTREYSVTVEMDGKPIHNWNVTPKNVFALQTNVQLSGSQIPAGKHTFKVTRKGEGKVYFSSFVKYFSKEDRLKATGNMLAIDRKYYKLTEKVTEVTINKKQPDGTVKEIKEKRTTWERTPMEYGAQMKSGDKIEVELNLKADNDFEYLAFEDFKPAGCEPVALRSGRGWAGGLAQNVELRDDRVAFFVSYMPQGTARLKYQLRCEIPGRFSALPTQGGSMYVPEIAANSEEFVIRIVD